MSTLSRSSLRINLDSETYLTSQHKLCINQTLVITSDLLNMLPELLEDGLSYDRYKMYDVILGIQYSDDGTSSDGLYLR